MATSKPAQRLNWAEDDDDDPQALPAPEIRKNPDGTETHITYRWREDGKKIKTTRVIRKTVLKHRVNPRVAERRAWSKFGASAKDAVGPQSDTTTVGENIELYPRQNFRSAAAGGNDAELSELERKKEALKVATVKCRICGGEHFTARCPHKGAMAPEGEPGMGAEPADDPMAEAGVASVKGSYVPPALRKGGAAATGDRMGRYERDDLATLRVTNVSEFATEPELRAMFERYGRVTRVFLAKDRETQKAKGFAFVSFADRSDAANACSKMDGFGYQNLILRVEFAKKST